MPALSFKNNKRSSMRLAKLIAVGHYSEESLAEIKSVALEFAINQEASLLKTLQEVQGVSRLLPEVDGIGAYRYMVDKVVDTQYDYEVAAKDLRNGVVTLEDERDTTLLDQHGDIYKKMYELGIENYAEMPSEEIIPQVQTSLEVFLDERRFVSSLESYFDTLDESVSQEKLTCLHDKLRGLFHHSIEGLEAISTIRHELNSELTGEE